MEAGPRRLVPIAYSETLHWRDQARCKGEGNNPRDLERFFPRSGGSPKKGKEVCASCPVIVECGDYAEKIEATDGIWGGKVRER